MAISKGSIDDFTMIENSTLQEIKNSIEILNEKFDLRWRHQDMQFKNLDEKFNSIDKKFLDIDKRFDSLDKKIEKVDTRMWQIIILLLSYPLGLIVGKLCHIF